MADFAERDLMLLVLVSPTALLPACSIFLLGQSSSSSDSSLGLARLGGQGKP